VLRVERPRSGAILVIAVLAASILAVPALAEVVRGTGEGELLVGSKRADKIIARGGDDRVKGKAGADYLIGGAGADKIVGGIGFDEMRGGGAADVIAARDGERDTIICGRGFDRVFVDAVEDGVFDCEEVIEP
jgi:Ca2+-binding RTX toxin-like protein